MALCSVPPEHKRSQIWGEDCSLPVPDHTTAETRGPILLPPLHLSPPSACLHWPVGVVIKQKRKFLVA